MLWTCIYVFAVVSTIEGRGLFDMTFFDQNKWGLMGEPRWETRELLPSEEWFEQKLDHFYPVDTRTWLQRFYTNGTFHREGGPVFLLIGGEGEANPGWMVSGQWIEAAEKFGALCFYVEHRYYGQSRPLEDMSTDNLKYLTSQQALADLAYFIQQQTEKLNLQNEKWVAFGGSYPGNLAAWLRMKYPHLVHASVASSAPVLAQVDFTEYLDVVTDVMYRHSPSCITAIRDAVSELESLLQNSDSSTKIQEMFKLCEPLNTTDLNEVAFLFEQLASSFSGAVQYSKRTGFSKSAARSVQSLCATMTDVERGSPLARYAEINGIALNATEVKCHDFNWVHIFNETDWDSAKSSNFRQWTYQTCVEFGYFQSSSSPSQPFGNHFPVSFFIDQCTELFGKNMNATFVADAIKWSNSYYGGYDISGVTRVVFLNGNEDPWHKLGILEDLNPDAPAIFIQGTSHCIDMFGNLPGDPPQLLAARAKTMELLEDWLLD